MSGKRVFFLKKNKQNSNRNNLIEKKIKDNYKIIFLKIKIMLNNDINKKKYQLLLTF